VNPDPPDSGKSGVPNPPGSGKAWAATLRGHDPRCVCPGCAFLTDAMTREARASVALDRDERVQTISLDEWDQP
jgi:hypothetical protein